MGGGRFRRGRVWSGHGCIIDAPGELCKVRSAWIAAAIVPPADTLTPDRIMTDVSSSTSPSSTPVRRIDVVGLSALSIGADDAPVALVFLHANGVHAALYADLLAPLARDRRIIALDQRGHGRTTLPADPARLKNWRVFIDDAVRALEVLRAQTADGDTIALAGHSLGGSVALLAAAERPDLARGVALLEPVIAAWGVHMALRASLARRFAAGRLPIATGARLRRRRFASREAAVESYRGRGGFRTWPEAALRAYVEEGFQDSDDGDGVVLRCDPAWEAAIYVALGHDVWGALRAVEAPVVIRAGAEGSTFPPASERRARALRPDADIERLEGATHFLPIERPDVARAAIESVLAGVA